MTQIRRSTMVEAFVKLQDIACAEKVTAAVRSFFAADDGNYSFAEIRDGGTSGTELLLVFIGSGQDHRSIADSVHEFLNAFMDEFYDESLEDDWLNEIDCDEMPVIVSFDVNEAKAYIGGDDEKS